MARRPVIQVGDTVQSKASGTLWTVTEVHYQGASRRPEWLEVANQERRGLPMAFDWDEVVRV